VTAGRGTPRLLVRGTAAWLGPGKVPDDVTVVCDGGQVGWVGTSRLSAEIAVAAGDMDTAERATAELEEIRRPVSSGDELTTPGSVELITQRSRVQILSPRLTKP